MNHEQSSFFKELLKTASILYKDKMPIHDSDDLYPIGFIPQESDLGCLDRLAPNACVPNGHIYFISKKPNLYFVNGLCYNHNAHYENNAMLLFGLLPNMPVTLCFESLSDTKNYIASKDMVLICQ